MCPVGRADASKGQLFLIGLFPCSSLPNNLFVVLLLIPPSSYLTIRHGCSTRTWSKGRQLVQYCCRCVEPVTRHDPSGLVLTPQPRIGAIMNMVIKSHTLRVSFADQFARFSGVQCTVCECRIEECVSPAFLKAFQ